MRRSFDWYVVNGCELQSPDIKMFRKVYDISDKDEGPCKECNCKDTCPAWPIIQAEEEQAATLAALQDEPQEVWETNTEVAKRLGISKRQAAKLRREHAA